MGWYSYNDWRPYVPVAERRRRAARKVAKMKKAGCKISPIEIVGRKIATTFWGQAWCKNLESYSDYANRLPRGRTYVRNGSVVDLQIDKGRVRSLVSGTDIYEVDIQIKRLAKKRWTGIKNQCAGKIDSLVELLQGSISKGVMVIVTRKGEGLFPSPREISLSCTCLDWASMCKHVAATLYGVGARLDREPELLFTLRYVDPAEMVEHAVGQPPTAGRARKGRVLAADELSSVFGVDIDMSAASADDATVPATRSRRAERTKKNTDKRSDSVKKPTAKKRSTKKAAAKKTVAKRAPTNAGRRVTKQRTTEDTAPKKRSISRETGIKKVRKKTGTKKLPSRKQASKKKTSSGRAVRTMKSVSTRRTSR